MIWTEEAREIVQDLLQQVPLPLRAGLEQAASERAENIVETDSGTQVQLQTAVRAFIECTPPDLRERLKHTLSYMGIDPDDYAAAFSA